MLRRKRVLAITLAVAALVAGLLAAALLFVAPQDEAAKTRELEQAAARHEYGDGVELDHPRAVQLYRKACELGSAPACGQLGRLLWAGSGRGEADSASFEMMTRGCDGGDGRACAYLVGNHYRPQNRKNQPAKAFEVAQLACELDSGLGCDLLAELSFEHQPGFTESDAQALWQRAETRLNVDCDAGQLHACRHLADTLSQTLYRKARPAAALAVLKRACEQGDPQSCSKRAAALAWGVYGPIDIEGAVAAETQAEAAQERYCSAGAWGSCQARAQRGYRDGNAEALDAAAKACGAGLPLACYYAAFKSGPMGARGALEHLEAACRNRDPPACYDLAFQRASLQGFNEASGKLLVRACDLGQLTACRTLLAPDLHAAAAPGRAGLRVIADRGSQRCLAGDAHACMMVISIKRQLARDRGDVDVLSSSSPELTRARALSSRDCQRDSAAACRRAGLAFEMVPNPEREAARAALDKACTLGDALACSASAARLARSAPSSSAEYRQRALELTRAGCEAGWSPACDKLREITRPRDPPPPADKPRRPPAP